jgi:hypothetical protein
MRSERFAFGSDIHLSIYRNSCVNSRVRIHRTSRAYSYRRKPVFFVGIVERRVRAAFRLQYILQSGIANGEVVQRNIISAIVYTFYIIPNILRAIPETRHILSEPDRRRILVPVGKRVGDPPGNRYAVGAGAVGACRVFIRRKVGRGNPFVIYYNCKPFALPQLEFE